MKKRKMFERLVENGLNFLLKAISELKNEPKYSVIHFHAAVELFLKSRLMYEHWSLIVAKRQEPDWDKFISGDFQSVTLKDAATRLDKVVRSGLSKADLDSFEVIGKHRNKMVHFFHESHSTEECNQLTQNILKQQLKAWYFLHRLLIVQWKDVFGDWHEKIADIDGKLRKLHEFLQVVFDDLGPLIANQKINGFLFEQCPSCEFDAQKHIKDIKEIYYAECLVCGLVKKCLKIECPDCVEVVTLQSEGFANCQVCGQHIEPSHVAEALIDSTAAHIAAMDGDDTWLSGNCSECDGYQTIVPTENDEWICASCFEIFDSLSTCGWCNEPNTGDMEDSYVIGCNFCEGMTGWHKDD